MTMTMEPGEALQESFRAALVLTGSMDGAERAVTNAIMALRPGSAAIALLGETVRSASRCGESAGEAAAVLPVEMRALSILPPTRRYCFVLHILLGFEVEACSEILMLSRQEVEEALRQSLLGLPGAVESVRGKGAIPAANECDARSPFVGA